MFDWLYDLHEQYGWRWLLRPFCWVGLHHIMHGISCDLGSGETQAVVGCMRCEWMDYAPAKEAEGPKE